MTLREHARQLIELECEMLCRGRRCNGFEYPKCCAEDEKGIARRVLSTLRNEVDDNGTRLYGSIQLWCLLHDPHGNHQGSYSSAEFKC